ncbi:MAG: hypothetical protein KDK34_00715, partial [Leptospiraceae bacterium]|nr:hypothetical protein [Leptospiraceae bacterium]
MAGCTPLLMHCGGSAGAQDSDSTLLLSLLQNENDFSSDSSAYTSNLTVNLERVRYCKNWLCTKQTTPSKFRYWEEEGVGRGHQRDTYIATISQPSRSNVENLVFFAAGQQPPGNGVPNSLTGQDDKYKKNCEGRTASCNRSIDGRSLTRQVMASGMFPMNRTFMAVAFDTQFNHLRSSDEKADMERAYLRWLLDKAYSSNVKRIYLAGSSRGGCLVMRLAQAIRENYSYRNIPLIVHSFDGVCKRTQNELGTYNSKIYNPLN